MPLWPFSSRARTARADRKARERRAACARADAEWEVLCMTGGTAVPGTEPYDGALRRDRRASQRAASKSNSASTSSTDTQQPTRATGRTTLQFSGEKPTRQSPGGFLVGGKASVAPRRGFKWRGDWAGSQLRHANTC